MFQRSATPSSSPCLKVGHFTGLCVEFPIPCHRDHSLRSKLLVMT